MPVEQIQKIIEDSYAELLQHASKKTVWNWRRNGGKNNIPIGKIQAQEKENF
jgi:hypothetical protein